MTLQDVTDVRKKDCPLEFVFILVLSVEHMYSIAFQTMFIASLNSTLAFDFLVHVKGGRPAKILNLSSVHQLATPTKIAFRRP